MDRKKDFRKRHDGKLSSADPKGKYPKYKNVLIYIKVAEYGDKQSAQYLIDALQVVGRYKD